MRVQAYADDTSRLAIGDLLVALLPGDARDGLAGSLAACVGSPDYTFLVGYPDGADEALAEARAVAIVSCYERPMESRTTLGVEALAVRDPDANALPFLRELARLARKAGDHEVAIAPAGVGNPDLL